MSADDLNDLAAALGRLRPTPPALDRDALMYRAGQHAGRRGLVWPLSAAAAAGLLAVVFGALWLNEVTRPPRERLVQVPVPMPVEPTRTPEEPPETSPHPPPASLPLLVREPGPLVPERCSPVAGKREMEDHLLRWGFDGLAPAPTAAPPRAATVDELLRSF